MENASMLGMQGCGVSRHQISYANFPPKKLLSKQTTHHLLLLNAEYVVQWEACNSTHHLLEQSQSLHVHNYRHICDGVRASQASLNQFVRHDRAVSYPSCSSRVTDQ